MTMMDTARARAAEERDRAIRAAEADYRAAIESIERVERLVMAAERERARFKPLPSATAEPHEGRGEGAEQAPVKDERAKDRQDRGRSTIWDAARRALRAVEEGADPEEGLDGWAEAVREAMPARGHEAVGLTEAVRVAAQTLSQPFEKQDVMRYLKRHHPELVTKHRSIPSVLHKMVAAGEAVRVREAEGRRPARYALAWAEVPRGRGEDDELEREAVDPDEGGGCERTPMREVRMPRDRF